MVLGSGEEKTVQEMTRNKEKGQKNRKKSKEIKKRERKKEKMSHGVNWKMSQLKKRKRSERTLKALKESGRKRKKSKAASLNAFCLGHKFFYTQKRERFSFPIFHRAFGT